MPTVGQLRSRNSVLRAITLFDRMGRREFLRDNGFGTAKTWMLVYRGRQYDSKAIVGVALGFEIGTAMRSKDFRGGLRSVVPKLKSLGFVVVALEVSDASVRLPEEVGQSYPEGAVRSILVDRVERSAQARIDCIEAHGHCCAACGLDFAERYGKEFSGLIHVHHLRPLSRSKKKGRRVNPKRDLRPICPNCHAAIHWGGKTRHVETVARRVEQRRRTVV